MSIFTCEQFTEFEALVRDCGRFMLGADKIESTEGSIKKKNGDADFVTVFDEGVQARLIEGLTLDNPTEISNLMCDVMINK